MHLSELAERYIACHDLSAGHAKNLRMHVRLFGNPELELFTADMLNRNLKQLRETKHSDSYIKSRKQHLLLLWRYAASLNLMDDPQPSQLMRVRVRDLVVEAYTLEQATQLVAFCCVMKGRYESGVRRAQFWNSLIRAAWDTGLSVAADLLRVRRSWIDANLEITMNRSKTGKMVHVALHPSTVRAIDAMGVQSDDTVWPWPFSLESLRCAFKKIAAAAGVGGSLKMLRSGSGTSVEEIHGHGEQHLGNTRQIFERHYNKARQMARLPADIPAVVARISSSLLLSFELDHMFHAIGIG